MRIPSDCNRRCVRCRTLSTSELSKHRLVPAGLEKTINRLLPHHQSEGYAI